MTRLIPLALVSMMTLSGCVTQTGALHAEPPRGAVHEAARPHAGSAAGGRSVRDFSAAVSDLAELVQDITATSDDADDEDDSEPTPIPSTEAVRVAEVYYGYVPGRSPPPAALTMPATTPAPQHHPLDPALAFAAVHAVDVSSCSNEGGAGGYGHARVTFGADGHTAGLLVRAPQGVSKEAEDCIEHRFGAASVSPFDGGPVTVGTSFYVK